jgi:predicted ester cyclase
VTGLRSMLMSSLLLASRSPTLAWSRVLITGGFYAAYQVRSQWRVAGSEDLTKFIAGATLALLMSIEANKEIVRRQFEYINSGEVEGASALWAVEGLNHGRKVDRAGLSRVYESLRSLQERHVIQEMIGEGDWVSVRTTCSGIHAASPKIPVNGGIFTGVEPAGRGYQVQHIHMFKVTDGLITEHWATRDDLGAALQIGLTLKPSPT